MIDRTYGHLAQDSEDAIRARLEVSHEYGPADCIDRLTIDGDTYNRVRFGREFGSPAADRCHDCGTVAGNFHHQHCDVERCPKCGDQLISCSQGLQGFEGSGGAVVSSTRLERR